MKCRLLIFLLLFIIGLNISTAKEKTVTEYKDITLSSDNTFFCQPIFNEAGECLIRAYIDINSKKEFNNDITITFKDKGIDAITNKATKFKGLTNKDKSKTNINVIKDKIQRIEFEFFTSKSGKFDVNIGSYVLDPYYNVTINSSSPSYHLINSSSNNASDNNYLAKTEISSGLSDKSDATKYGLSYALVGTQFISNTMGVYRFEEGSGTTIIDSSSFANNGNNRGAIYSSSKGNNATVNYSLYFNSTARVNVSSNNQNSFTYPQVFTIGCWFNASKSPATTRGIMSKGFVTSSNQNYNMYINGATNNSWFGVGNGTSNIAIGTSAKTITQGQWTHMAVTANETRMCIYLNGVMKTCSAVTIKWKSTTGNLVIGGQTKTTNPFLGKIDECSIFNRSLSRTEILNWYNGGAVTYYNIQGKSIKPYFNYSTINYSYKHFLDIKKVNAGLQSFKVHPYINATDINKSLSITDILQQGYDSIEVTSIIKPSKPLSFRIFPLSNSANISEITLIEERIDDTPPQITNCKINTSSLTCSESLLFSCNVTDNIELKQVFFGILNNNTYNYQMVDRISPSSNTFYQTITAPTIHATYNYSFILVNASDFINNYFEFNPSVVAEYSCCLPEWQFLFINLSNCSGGAEGYLNQKIYNDTHQCNKQENLPFDNGTTINIPCSSPSKLIINRCPDTIQLSMILIALLFIALAMIAFSIVHQIGVIGLFGSILLIVLSWYVVGCSALIGYIIGLFAIVMLVITSVIIPWIKYKSNQ